MRFSGLVLSAVMALTIPAFAQTSPAPSNIIFGKSVPIVPMAEWEVGERAIGEQTGARILIAAGEVELVKAPPKASRYDSQTFKFPSGQLRVLSFKKKSGGVLHQITTETEIYVLKGSAVVDVRGVPTEIKAGDVVNLPSGVMRSRKNKVEDTTILAFTVGNTAKDPQAVLVRGKDTPDRTLPAGQNAAPKAAKVSVQRYNFDGNSIRVARQQPGITPSVKPGVDVLIYVASGRMMITVGDEVKEVTAGDALREEAGKPTHWDVLENSMFIATNAPRLPLAAAK